MRLPRPARRRALDTALPMINVVFLLLIFFLMSAHLVREDPLGITPPKAEGAAFDEGPDTLFLGADGTIHWQGLTGEAALAALSGLGIWTGAKTPLILRADRAVEGEKLAALLARLAVARPGPVRIVVEG